MIIARSSRNSIRSGKNLSNKKNTHSLQTAVSRKVTLVTVDDSAERLLEASKNTKKAILVPAGYDND